VGTAMMLDVETIARALGGEIRTNQKTGKKFVVAPGPGHSAEDRSLSIQPDPAAPSGFLVNTFANDDPIVCKEYVRTTGYANRCSFHIAERLPALFCRPEHEWPPRRGRFDIFRVLLPLP
jgi:hypothetical protein